MPENHLHRVLSERGTVQPGLTIPTGLFAVLFVSILALLGIGMRYHAHGDWDAIHSLFSLFFSTNLLISYWEVCLLLRRDYVEMRTGFWRERRSKSCRTPAREFLFTRVPLTQVLSPTLWADVWATYSQYDGSYADRRSFGFNADIANGIVTPAPTLILYVAYTSNLLPAVPTGVLGVMLFWQWTYVTSVYWVSFFVARRHTRISRGEVYTYICAINSPWVLCPLLGLYVSVRLIVDGNYTVLGF